MRDSGGRRGRAVARCPPGVEFLPFPSLFPVPIPVVLGLGAGLAAVAVAAAELLVLGWVDAQEHEDRSRCLV